MIAESSVNRTDSVLRTLLQRRRVKAKPWNLSDRDVTNVDLLLAGLKDPSNPAAVFLLTQMSQANRDKIASCVSANGNSADMRIILANELNKQIDGAKSELLKADFSKVNLRISTSALLATKPTGKEQKRLRRLLIEDCFPDGLTPLPADWDSPSDWLEMQNGIPSVKSIRELVPNVAPWLLIEALCGYSDKEEELLAGIMPIIGNLNEQIAPTFTRREWLAALAALLRANKAQGQAFSQCLEQHWGPMVVQTTSTQGTRRSISPLTYSAYCAAALRLWFDPREGAFYRYRGELGTWTFSTDVEVQRLLLERMLEDEGELPEVKPSLAFAEQIMRHLRVIALYEKTDLPELPVHLADEMLYLGEERQPAPFSPAYFSKNRIPIRYDHSETASNTMFAEFLEGSIAEEDVDLLQKWCGYVLLGKNPHHKILLVRGVGGSGKSTLMDIIETIIGAENVASLNVDRLDDRFELAAFRDKTLLIGKDVASNILKSKAAHTLKGLSGDQGIEAELKFENRRFKLSGPFNIAITSNADLEIGLRGDAVAWERRLLIIDFNKVVKDKILNYAAKIIESSPEGILNWMLRGAQEVLKMERTNEPLELSIRQRDRLQRLLQQSASNDIFIKACVEASPGKAVASRTLYKNYLEFCDQQVFNPIDEELFYKRIRFPLFQLHQAEASENLPHADTESRRGYRQIAIKPCSKWPPRYSIPSDYLSPTKISEEDIRNHEGMRAKLNDKGNAGCQWVWADFTKEEKEAIARAHSGGDGESTTILKILTAGLTRFVKSRLDYDKAMPAIAAVGPRSETNSLLEQRPTVAADVHRLKRMLLEDMFPSELARMQEAGSSPAAEPLPPNTGNTDDTPF